MCADFHHLFFPSGSPSRETTLPTLPMYADVHPIMPAIASRMKTTSAAVNGGGSAAGAAAAAASTAAPPAPKAKGAPSKVHLFEHQQHAAKTSREQNKQAEDEVPHGRAWVVGCGVVLAIAAVAVIIALVTIFKK